MVIPGTEKISSRSARKKLKMDEETAPIITLSENNTMPQIWEFVWDNNLGLKGSLINDLVDKRKTNCHQFLLYTLPNNV